MNNIPIKNAVIKGTMLGIEDHGIMTCFLNLDYGGSGQSFGGYSLDGFNESEDKRVGTAWGMEFIRRVLEVLDVDSWEKIKGTHCRVKADHGKVYRIGHIIKDQWFDPKQDLEYLK